MLLLFLKSEVVRQLILFTATREDTDRLAALVQKAGFAAVGLNGKLTQAQRNAVMQAFAANKYQVLVTTDVASRGLDFLQVSHVINFHLPKHPEEYVHRIGRTGRAGQQGCAFSLVGPKDIVAFSAIEQFLRRPLEMAQVEGLLAKFDGTVKKKPVGIAAKTSKATGQRSATAKAKIRSADSPLPKKKPKFFESGDDGAAPPKKKQK